MAAPEFFAKYPVPSCRTLGWKDEKSLHYLDTKAFFEAASVEVVSSFSAVPLGALVEEPPTLMWEHQGRCQCGRRSYLFGQCSKCLKEEMLEKAAEEEKRQAEEPEEPSPSTVEVDPDPVGGQGLPSELPDPVTRTGPSTEHVDFLTSRDVLDILHGGRYLVGWVTAQARGSSGNKWCCLRAHERIVLIACASPLSLTVSMLWLCSNAWILDLRRITRLLLPNGGCLT